MVKNDIIHIRINNDIKEELRAIAGEKGLTLSSLVGLIISEYSKEVKELVE